MKNRSPKKKTLKQKLAVALSVVNALNVCAPIALPYVNVAKNVRADGGHAERLSGALACSLYGTTQAYTNPVENGTVNSETLDYGGTQNVNNGGTANYTTINSSGTQNVNNGGTANYTTISNGGTQNVEGGGVASNTIIASNGKQNIKNGGVGSATTNNSGFQNIQYGGVGSVTTLKGGNQNIDGGGKGYITTMDNNGTQTVSNGGSGTVETLNDGFQNVRIGGTGTVSTMSGGRQYINTRGSSAETGWGTGTVSTMSGGQQHVCVSGTGTVEIMSGGTQLVWKGGTGTVSKMSGGTQVVNDSNGTGTATGTVTSMHGGMQIINRGETGTGSGTVSSMTGGTQVVRSGGSGTVATMTGGTQSVASGATGTVTTMSGGTQAVGLKLNSSGSLVADSGGTGFVTTMNAGTQIVLSGGSGTVSSMTNGTQNVSNGGSGTVSSMTGGTQTIENGGVGSVTSLGGTQTVKNGGTSKDTTVNNGGIQKAMLGGILAGTQTISAGGSASGGTLTGTQSVAGQATGITVATGGTQIVENGGTASGTMLASGYKSGSPEVLYSGGVQIVSGGGLAVSTTISGTSHDVSAGMGGTQVVSAGGIARASKDAGGVLELHNGAVLQKADSTAMDYGDYALSGGTLRVTDGVSVNYSTYTLSNGTIEVTEGGTASIDSVGPQGIQIISGGSASGTVETLDGIQKIYASGTGSATVMGGYAGNAAHQEIYSAGTGTIGTMNYGVQTVNSGGTGIVTTMSGGTQVINGKIESGSTIYGHGTVVTMSGGEQIISNGGTGTVSTMTGGVQTISSGGTGTVTALMSGGTQVLYTGGTSLNTIVKSGGMIKEEGSGEKHIAATFEAGGIHHLAGGATKENMTVSGHVLELGDGGIASITTVGSGGTARVLSGGTAERTRVNSGGVQTVNGGTAYSTIVNSGGEEIVNGGGATGTQVRSGGVQTVNGGEAAITYVMSGGSQTVASGGTATNTTVDSGGVQIVNSGGVFTYTNVLDGGTAKIAAMTGGDLTVQSGGIVQNTDGSNVLQGYGTISGGENLSANQVVVSGGTMKADNLTAQSVEIADGNARLEVTDDLSTDKLTVSALPATGAPVSAGGTVSAGTLDISKLDGASIQSGAALELISAASAVSVGAVVYDGGTASLFPGSTQTLTTPYTHIISGVTIDAHLTQTLSMETNAINYTAGENRADKLTFGDVEWKNTGALIDHSATLSNVSFNGADVDTTNINFTNIKSLEANKKMTLVSNWDGAVGTITGTKYKVGSTLEGEGKASLVGNDLIFTAETGTNNENLTPQEQTHNTVMGAEVGMAALSVGNDFIGAATEGLSLASNVGADGVSSFAKMGGGSMRQETGSHVDTHTWNAILALGHKNKKERGTFEYGAFFEYGTGNYTTHNGDERGDGSARYTGGGLLAKWTAAHGFYVEGSLRAGTVHDDARNVLRDADGAPYSYETNAPYFGAHIGVGKEIPLANGNTVDVYGKYFYNRRNGVSFNAGGHYDLDAVTSSVIRLGARYTVNRDKWKFYAGAAYEHELDGKAKGTADGVAIRGADIGGGSFRGELGATVTPGENSPWNIDFNVTGFAGKKQGVTGGVSVSFMF